MYGKQISAIAAGSQSVDETIGGVKLAVPSLVGEGPAPAIAASSAQLAALM